MSSPDEVKTLLKNRRYSSGQQAARDVLLLCITTRMSPAKREIISGILAGTVDWKYLLKLAEFHGVAPLVFHNISTNNLSKLVDRTCLERLQTIYDETLYKNVIYTAELGSILSAFKENGIPAIALKGVTLAEMLYGNPALRTVLDLDILMRRDDLPRAGSLLDEMGYQKSTLPGDIDHPFHEVPYIKRAKISFFVELHWNLEDERLVSIPQEKLWERARTLRLPWGQVMVISFEDTLMFSAIQLFKQSDQLKILGDIAELLKKCEETLDWNYITDAARSWGIDTALYYSLRKAGELLEAPVPLSATKKLRPKAWRRWAIDLLSGRQLSIIPLKQRKLRAETLNLVRSLMMSEPGRMLRVLEKHRGRGSRGVWLRAVSWIILVLIAALGRNIAGMVSGGR
jgi:hypothetical protein